MINGFLKAINTLHCMTIFYFACNDEMDAKMEHKTRVLKKAFCDKTQAVISNRNKLTFEERCNKNLKEIIEPGDSVLTARFLAYKTTDFFLVVQLPRNGNKSYMTFYNVDNRQIRTIPSHINSHELSYKKNTLNHTRIPVKFSIKCPRSLQKKSR